MSWTAIVPFKASGERKSRLAAELSADERTALSIRMFRHVVDVLQHHTKVARTLVLSNERPTDWSGAWMQDEGGGLNAELERVRSDIGGDILILHADLPLLQGEDIDALLDAAQEEAIAIAPDRHGSGTNGLALKVGTAFVLHFGPNSFHLHREQAPTCPVVRLDGFGFDLDTPNDLKALEKTGWL
jgi:2-phospho-L-lactate guanylyltransferase